MVKNKSVQLIEKLEVYRKPLENMWATPPPVKQGTKSFSAA